MKTPVTASLHLALAITLLAPLSLQAQDLTPVPCGKGSYASGPPAGKPASFDATAIPLLKDEGRPIPSNSWNTALFYQQSAKGLWFYPGKVDATGNSVSIFYPVNWKDDGSGLIADNAVTVSAADIQGAGTKTKDWSDWLSSFRIGGDDKYMDVTVGEGMPCIWIECKGVSPTISVGGGGGGKKGAPAAAAPGGTSYFDLQGAPATLPLTGDAIGITTAGRSYAVFAPDGTKFDNGGGLSVTFSAPADKQFLIVCPLPDAKDIGTFHQYAYAIPRQTTLSWKYDPDAGIISTEWQIKTEPLKGDNTKIIQGWLPHHYRTNVAKVDFLPLEYTTVRGKMKCTATNDLTFTYNFAGLVPNLPAPTDAGYDAAKLKSMLDGMAAAPKFAGDTYWGGKDLERQGQAALMAKMVGDEPARAKLADATEKMLEDWFTYTPGEKNHFFAEYPHHKGMVGFGSSYGSDTFVDNHFHLGYFAFSSGLIAMQDPQFVTDYGPMATRVTKQFANWDHNDKEFPFLRTFDKWAGHSWADGTGSGDGQSNQESSSEATNSWAGVIFLGQALGNKDMLAAGIMGYNYESQSTLEYWFNWKGDNFSPKWAHPINSMTWSDHNAYATYFSGDAEWKFGIQWIPTSPMLTYFVRDPQWASKTFDSLKAEKGGNVALAGDLGSYIIGYVAMYDPKTAISMLDGFNDKDWGANVYYEAHSQMTIGHPDWSCHGSDATSMVYVNDATKARTYIVWNPSATAKDVTFYEGSKSLGHLAAAPQTITSTTTLAN